MQNPRPSFGKVVAFPLKHPSTPSTPPVENLSAVSTVSRARLGMILFIGSEAMLFAGLLAVYASLRFGSASWPPAHLYLPIRVTWINTGFLFFSCYTMWKAQATGRANDQVQFVWFLTLTGIFGVLFLGIQGYEWLQILHEGVMTKARIYGSTFYLLIGCHALHVFGAVMWLWFVIQWAKNGRLFAPHFIWAELCSIYWYFVGAVWAILFPLVYLS
jgi:heme/copper-type cytochrome/quinol oxidase subunit 3